MTTTDIHFLHRDSVTNEEFSQKESVQQQSRYLHQKRAHLLQRQAMALAIGCMPMCVNAQPAGGQVVSGNASIVQSGTPGQTVTTVKQNSSTASIQWKSFNLGTGDLVQFVQPSKNAVAINRISDTAGSKIMGTIQANGQVWLINPNGILFGKDAQINVGGLLATTLSTFDPTVSSQSVRVEQLLSGSSKAAVVNLGHIQSADSGIFSSMELRVLLPQPGDKWNIQGQWYASIFWDKAVAQVNQNPWNQKSNFAYLRGTGLALYWQGPNEWRASASLGKSLGSVSSLLTSADAVHQAAWIELAKGWR